MLSILDKTWNEAIEAAAATCNDTALALRSMNGDSDTWVWPMADRFQEQAEEIRKLKRA